MRVPTYLTTRSRGVLHAYFVKRSSLRAITPTPKIASTPIFIFFNDALNSVFHRVVIPRTRSIKSHHPTTVARVLSLCLCPSRARALYLSSSSLSNISPPSGLFSFSLSS